MLFGKKWDPRGRHCFVTGGSSGTGLALAVMLAQRGADVSIVARNKERLDKALEILEAARQTPKQILKAYSFAVDSEAGSLAAIKAASEPFEGRCPEAFFLVAGAARPSYFVEQDEELLRNGMQISYWAQACTALAGSKEMARQGVKGKIVFVSSVLAFFSIVGYSTYSPGKFAIRGLAEALQSELKLYDIDVHISFPPTIYTSGYEEENKTKPAITLKIEETDSGLTPEQVAAGIFKGVQRGNFHITTGWIGDTFRASTAGSSPRNSYIADSLYALFGFWFLPVWRKTVDSQVKRHRAEHQEYLKSRGFFST
ncbi:oxidoreductase [Trametes versicolor FP-101664 SS1]|uniref:oxidoreductase n=1 Tax=Trametes versicolor (strain FP-101664) TaxID=717944 RepID=UPI0004623567|nr:oxidoreductase [Trametes versicolor FP-101664 SS1]EIW57851.1 oxidoreductase [Trametes versicolor FP-101664 SS1]